MNGFVFPNRDFELSFFYLYILIFIARSRMYGGVDTKEAGWHFRKFDLPVMWRIKWYEVIDD